ncbi:MAG TPA: ABC transporter ATP-binding protein [Acidobacteria bacterium]|nr:ABC transporter ATP-binding protein [Acidobacteriota bacterium]
MIAWVVLLLVQGLLPLATVWLTKVLVDRLVAAVKAGGSWEVVRGPLVIALVLAGLLLLGEVLRALTRWIRTAQGELVQDHIASLIQERAVAADLALYDSADYFDKLHRARVDAQNRPVVLVENLGTLLQSTLTLIAMAAVLLRFGWWLPLALLVSTVPALAVVVRYALRQHRWLMNVTEDRRRTVYYDWLMTSREAAPEVRLLGTGEHFRQLYGAIRDRLRGERLELARSEAVAEISAAVIGLVVMGAAVAWMVVRAARGSVTLGDLAMFYQAFSQGQRLMRTLLETVGQIYSNSLFLENLFEFLELEPRLRDPERPLPVPATRAPDLVFRSVSFRYPGQEHPVLEGFDLEIPGGTVAALIGSNGAGKSTLLRLLCRLYDPEIGSVEIGGRDLREMRLEEVRGMISVLMQEPVRYGETARRNIELGAVHAGPELEQVVAAAEMAGADRCIEHLPKGYETLLSRWFAEGVELSGGEWQRVALARAFLRESPVVLLDEPTSAMDSWSEADWMRRFRQLVEGRTALVITHRLTTAMRADVIHLMEAGRIVESGTHRELLARGGRYAEAWEKQLGARANGWWPEELAPGRS